MDLNDVKRQIVTMLQSVLSLDSSAKIEAMKFLKEHASNLGLITFCSEQRENCAEATAVSTNDLDSSFNKEDNQKEDNRSETSTIYKRRKEEIVNCGKILVESSQESNIENNNDSSNTLKSVNCGDSMLKEIHASESKNKHNKKNKQSLQNDYVVSPLPEDNLETLESSDSLKQASKEICLREKTSGKKTSSGPDYLNAKNEIMKCPGCIVTCESKTDLLHHFSIHGKALMSCRFCRSTFNSMLHLWEHQMKKECKMSPLKCSECGEKFKYRRHYLKHVLGHDENNCRYCDEKFSTWVLYKHHLKEKHPDIKMERDLIPCKFCAMSFRRHLGLYNHYQVEHSKGKFVCLSCGLLLPTKEKYKEHALVHESEKIWKCKICKMKFYRRQQLLFHVSVHKQGTYKCLTCDITVTSKVDLHKHKKDGHEVKGLEPKFECEICHKNFKKKVVLKNHMATHSKEKKYYCKHCVKSFGTSDALQKHQKRKSHFEKAKIVLPESKYEKVYEDKLICENCGKQYKTQRELNWHLRVHKSIYECHECGKTFTLKVNLTKHIRLHRNKVCVVCELCGNTFNQLSALNEHILMKHSDVRNAECEICKKKFKRKSELNRHMRIHEQKRPFACFCGTAFKQSSHLQTHYKTFHEKNQRTEGGVDNFADSTGEIVYEGTEATMVDRRKEIYENGGGGSALAMETINGGDYRNAGSFDSMQSTEGNMAANNQYGPLRYSHQAEMDPITVAYEDLNFEPSQTDEGKRELVFASPAIDLSMVTIPEVVDNEMGLGGHRNMAHDPVETFGKLPDEATNLQLVNLSERIVQEYLLNLP